MRSTIQLDADFPLSPQAKRIRTEFGATGLLMFDLAFRRAAQRSPIELYYTAHSDQWFCAEIGMPRVNLRNERGQFWSMDELWAVTGKLKLTRRSYDDSLIVVTFPGFINRFVRRERSHIPLTLRREVFERDEHCCVICGSTEDLQLDHIYPWSLGGEDTIENLQVLCRPHNIAKRDRVA